MGSLMNQLHRGIIEIEHLKNHPQGTIMAGIGPFIMAAYTFLNVQIILHK